MKQQKLTKRQLDIMKILWTSSKPLVASDFLEIDPSLNINTVQSSIRCLLKLEYIKVDSIVYSGTVLSRSYVATLTPDAYIANNFSDIIGGDSFVGIVANFIKTEENLETIYRLEEMIQRRKAELHQY